MLAGNAPYSQRNKGQDTWIDHLVGKLVHCLLATTAKP